MVEPLIRYVGKEEDDDNDNNNDNNNDVPSHVTP
jgi:hypothetical protein